MEQLFARNRAWAARMCERDPEFFARLAHQQAPRYLWIGCADSRVPATQITDLDPGSIFVHRNIANLVVHTDINMLSVVQFAVEILRVEHAIVCGHYGCGGVRAAMTDQQYGLIDHWLRHIREVHERHADELVAIADGQARERRLVELNVRHQVANLARTTIVQNAWARGQRLALHGWVYDVGDGLLHDLGATITGPEALGPVWRIQPPQARP